MNAVVETGGKQYRVTEGDRLEIDRLKVETGQEVVFDRVLCLGHGDDLEVGTPTVEGAQVVADVIEHRRGPKLIVFKMRRRKGYHKTKGHRQELSFVQIKTIKTALDDQPKKYDGT